MRTLLLALVLVFWFSLVWCQQGIGQVERRNPAKKPPRSPPPSRYDSETENLFKGDPFQDVRGSRPEKSRAAHLSGGSTGVEIPMRETSGIVPWVQLISAETVTDEIKNQLPAVGASVRRIGTFKGGGNRKVQKQYAIIATMFGIIAEYGEPIRWKGVSAAARNAFARAAANAKTASANAHQESKRRFEDLGELVRGGSVDFAGSEEDVLWSHLVDRRLLMQRIEEADKQRIKPGITDESEFKKNRSLLIHEAEMIAALAEIIQREEYEFYDDDDYLAYCKQLQQQARQLGFAVRENNLTEVQRRYGEIAKTCSACHEDYK